MSTARARKDYHGTRMNRRYQRFPADKVEGTGVDPLGSFREFLGKDLRRNIDVHRDTNRRSLDLDSRKELNMTVASMSQTSHFHHRRASEIPPSSLPDSTVNDIPKPLKPVFRTNQESGEGWKPPNYPSNLSPIHRIDYNPITCLPLRSFSIPKNTNIDARRRKGITEIADKQHLFYANSNPVHAQALAADPHTFHYRQGMFMHMYEASARQGFLNRPFPLARRKSPGFRD